MSYLFNPGMIVSTPGAQSVLTARGASQLLQRHLSGDWGDLDDEDKADNDLAVAQGDRRILSAYTLMDGTKIWIITEWDRSVTTFLLPEEY